MDRIIIDFVAINRIIRDFMAICNNCYNTWKKHIFQKYKEWNELTYLLTFFWHIFWYSFWHILWHSFWHIFWRSFGHFFWHSLCWAVFLSFFLPPPPLPPPPPGAPPPKRTPHPPESMAVPPPHLGPFGPTSNKPRRALLSSNASRFILRSTTRLYFFICFFCLLFQASFLLIAMKEEVAPSKALQSLRLSARWEARRLETREGRRERERESLHIQTVLEAWHAAENKNLPARTIGYKKQKKPWAWMPVNMPVAYPRRPPKKKSRTDLGSTGLETGPAPWHPSGDPRRCAQNGCWGLCPSFPTTAGPRKDMSPRMSNSSILLKVYQ